MEVVEVGLRAADGGADYRLRIGWCGSGGQGSPWGGNTNRWEIDCGGHNEWHEWLAALLDVILEERKGRLVNRVVRSGAKSSAI